MPARAPLAVDRLGRAGVSTVTSYGWISARTPSNRIRRSRRTAVRRPPATRAGAGRGARSATRRSRRGPGSGPARRARRPRATRRGSPRSRSRSGPSAGRRPEQRREHRPPDGRVGRHPVHHRPGEDPLRRASRRRGGPPRARRAGLPGSRRTRPRGRPATASWNLTARSPRATSRTWGNVDSQSIARCGSSIAATSADERRDGVRDAGRRRLVRRGRRRPRRGARARPSARSLTYDHSSSTSSASAVERVVGRPGGGDRVADRADGIHAQD